MTRYTSLKSFKHAQKSFTYVAEALTPLLRLGIFSWIVTCDSHQNNFSIPNLGRGPPARGPRPRLRTAALSDARHHYLSCSVPSRFTKLCLIFIMLPHG